MLIIKKVTARILFPVPLLFLLLLVGIYLTFYSKKYRNVGKWIFIGVLIFFYLIGIGGGLLCDTLSDRYRQLDFSTLNKNDKYVICVAGSGFSTDDSLPAMLRFTENATARMSEAARIAKYFEANQFDYSLSVSVGEQNADENAKIAGVIDYFTMSDIPSEKINVITHALHSRDEIKAFAKLEGIKIIVSQPFHVPRFMLLAKKYNVNALPAPSSLESYFYFSPLSLIPSGKNFADADTAIYEYLGMVEYLLF